MTSEQAHAFAQAWQEGWNSHDLDRILAHYREDIRFSSKKALALVGAGTVDGKAALRAYWAAALAQQPDLRFDLCDVFSGHQVLVITYLNHRGVCAAETLHFDDAGLVWMASACHREA